MLGAGCGVQSTGCGEPSRLTLASGVFPAAEETGRSGMEPRHQQLQEGRCFQMTCELFEL